jgi:large subunit ribosomal protein L7e
LVEKLRSAKDKGQIYVPAEAKLFLVIRTKGINAVPPKERKILQLFRLRQISNAVFVRRNKATENLLRKIEPYITFGYPSRGTISKLIYKRGFGKVNRQRIPLSSNFVVEQVLGKKNIICVEDLINEIATVGPAFKEAANFLWPIKLNSTRGGVIDKRRSYLNHGLFGNREQAINAFVRRML